MNREFRFRVWHNKAKKIFQGLSGRDVFAWEFEGQNVIIMQSTDLTDKNEKEIYEGEILKWGEEGRFIVKYGNGCFYGDAFAVNTLPGNLSYVHFINAEIIGNVFENQGLLND